MSVRRSLSRLRALVRDERERAIVLRVLGLLGLVIIPFIASTVMAPASMELWHSSADGTTVFEPDSGPGPNSDRIESALVGLSSLESSLSPMIDGGTTQRHQNIDRLLRQSESLRSNVSALAASDDGALEPIRVRVATWEELHDSIAAHPNSVGRGLLSRWAVSSAALREEIVSVTDRRFRSVLGTLTARRHALITAAGGLIIIMMTLGISLLRRVRALSTADRAAAARVEELEQALRQSTRQLDSARLELESFLYSVSHDLRAPLRVIGAAATVLDGEQRSHLSPEGQRMVSIVREQSDRMEHLVKDLLDLARWDHKGLKREPVDMSALVRSVVDDLMTGLDGPPAEVCVSELSPAFGDPTLLRQVWTNLLSNALKYSSHRRVRHIEVSSEIGRDDTTYRVKDNGTGFDMKYAGHLFGAFQRLHSDEEFEGTGVGLTIVRRLVLRHGGRVSAHAMPDAGATFAFSLPRLVEPGTRERSEVQVHAIA